jgi:hypothetical protein
MKNLKVIRYKQEKKWETLSPEFGQWLFLGFIMLSFAVCGVSHKYLTYNVWFAVSLIGVFVNFLIFLLTKNILENYCYRNGLIEDEILK